MVEHDKKTQVSPSQRVETTDKKQRLERYNAIVDTAELGDIFLQTCVFDIQPEYFLARSLGKSGEGPKPKFRIYSSTEGVTFVSADGVVGANFIWQVKTKVGRKQLLKLRCVYVCYYSGLEGQDEEAAIAFLKRVGRFATYSYFRSYVSQISWASGADLPMLPVLRESKRRPKSEPKSQEAETKPEVAAKQAAEF